MRRFDHIDLRVRNLDEARHFYEKLLPALGFSQEFQIEEGNTGDYWGVAGGVQDIPAFQVSGQYVYDPSVETITFSATSPAGRHCVKRGMYEISEGWNTVDLYCFKDTSIHVVNGNVVMVLYNSRQMEHGKKLPLVKGKLKIQSEGAEVFYKEIKIQPLSKLPADLFK